MTFQVTIHPSALQFMVNPGQTILDAALDSGIILPYSCRSGSCTSCKGKVIAGDYEAGQGTENFLTPEEKSEGYVLFCETIAKSALQIECREVRLASDIVVRKMPARVISMDPKGRDVMVLKLQLPASEPFVYKAGQYVEFILKGGLRRAYSVANAPGEGSVIELHIRHMPGGYFTDHVFGAAATAMKIREILRVEGPLGTFFLREDSDKPIIFLASGTGFAPVKAMMEDIIKKGSQRSIFFYWGGRRPDDLYMDELARQWAEQLPFFNYIPVVSEAQPEDQWQGRNGNVHQAVLDDFEDLSSYQVYACGVPIMVSSARSSFIQQKGLPESEFFADAFTSERDK